jgi:hypothetical protein
MNEQLVSWFEEILPDIKQGGDVKDTMLKFASKKNLAPALLEKLGHVYNTAKTVTYLDKCASEDKQRGESFQVLDVSEMIEAYTEKKADDHSFEDADFSSKSSGRFTDLFDEKRITFDDLENLEQAPDYQEVKLASERIASELKTSIKYANADQAEQLIFDLSEDNRKIASEIADYVRDSYNETSFEQLEQDAKYYFGDCVKEACDYVASYLDGIKYEVKRASDAGKSRLIEDTSFLVKFASIQDNLNNKTNAELFIEDTVGKKKEAATDTKPAPGDLFTEYGDLIKAPAEEEEKEEKAKRHLNDGGGGVDLSDSSNKDLQEIVSEDIDKAKLLAQGTGSAVGGAYQGALKTLGIKDKTIPGMLGDVEDTAKGFLDRIAPSRDEGAELIDRELDDAKYSTIIQDLIITDPILGEEDEDKVIDLYNTIKSVAPNLAKDKNVARVVLRQAVQYDGIAAPDLAQLVEAERSLQKAEYNTSTLNSMKYDKDTSNSRIVG